MLAFCNFPFILNVIFQLQSYEERYGGLRCDGAAITFDKTVCWICTVDRITTPLNAADVPAEFVEFTPQVPDYELYAITLLHGQASPER